MLDRILKASTQGLTLIEEDLGSVSSILAKQIGSYATSVGMSVCYLSSMQEGGQIQKKELVSMIARPGDKELLAEGMEGKAAVSISVDPGFLSLQDLNYDLIVFESFSAHLFERSDREVVDLMNEVRRLVKLQRNFLLLIETPMLSPKINSYLKSMADNVISIRTEIVGDSVTRQLYIAKMKGMPPMDHLLKFTIEEDGIQIDTREFVG